MTSEDLPVVAAEDDGLVRRAGRLAGWAARTGVSLAGRLPGLGNAGESLRQVERQVLNELRKRLDEVDDPYVVALSAASSREPAGEVVPAAEPLRSAMKELLDRSVTFDQERAREYLYATVLRQLTPDEARILTVLSDGDAYPAVDVVARGERILLRNASTVGTAAERDPARRGAQLPHPPRRARAGRPHRRGPGAGPAVRGARHRRTGPRGTCRGPADEARSSHAATVPVRRALLGGVRSGGPDSRSVTPATTV